MVPIPIAAVLEPAPPAFVTAALPACEAEQITLSFDGEDGDFDGMSHAGTLMVLRNIGAAACRVPGLPRLSFTGRDGATLPIAFRPPAGMHPGPVVLPVGIAPGAEVTAKLRWVSGDVYEGGRCLSPAAVTLSIGPARIGSAFVGTLCGPAKGPVRFEQTWLRADPRLKR